MEKLRPAQVVIVASGIVAFIASFLPWVDVFDETRSAWSDDLVFPTYTWVGIAGAIMAIVVLLEVFTTIRFPNMVGGFTWRQIHLVLSLLAVLLVISFLIAAEDFGFGFWLSLIASIGLLVGAIMLGRDDAIALSDS